MKHFALALALTVTSLTTAHVALATSIDTTPVVATLDGFEHGISKVTLMADGRLFLTMHDGSSAIGKINEKALEVMLVDARSLSEAKIKKEVTMRPCRMMVRPELNALTVAAFDFYTQEFTGESKPVLTRLGCTMTTTYRPIGEPARLSAERLRSNIRAFAFQFLK